MTVFTVSYLYSFCCFVVIEKKKNMTHHPSSPFRKDILKDRVVLISGGATGIGFGCALCFGEHGAKVAIMSRRKAKIDEAVSKLRRRGIDAFGTTVDVRDYKRCVDSVNRVANHFGRVDFLINNAAGNFMVSSENLSPNGLSTVLGIDLQGSFHMSRACLSHLKKTGAQSNGDAVIVNITATLQDMATPFQFHAASAKAGIDVLTNTIGTEWAEYGIRCVGLAPGGISGTVGGPDGRVFGRGTTRELGPVRIRRGGIPAGRWGQVSDVALAAVFMCSPAAPWITATRLVIDGGSVHRVQNFVEFKRAIQKKSDAEKARSKL
jgi:2,4-dienoyl-CoA reductase [(3E)-enoyl-CoA-producing], peroxisomal